MDGKKIVKDGYDQIAGLYNSRRLLQKKKNYKYFDKLYNYFPSKGRLLDLGCGGGIPVSSYFSEKGFQITGVDISQEMIEIARKQNPGGQFLVCDMTGCEFNAEEFDVIVSSFAIIHVPQEEQPELFRKIYRWLRPGGVAFLVLGSRNEKETTEEDWHGVKMFWSTFSSGEYRQLLVNKGFNILYEELVDIPDDAVFYNIIINKELLRLT